ncbi:MAG: sensor histidine kinase [Ilumatobacter sp.]
MDPDPAVRREWQSRRAGHDDDLIAVLLPLLLSFSVGGLAGGLGVWFLRRVPSSEDTVVDAAPTAPEYDDITDGIALDDIGAVLRSAVNELELGVVVGDANGRVIYRNRAASAMHGTHVGLIVEEHVDEVLQTAAGGVPAVELVELHGPPRVALRLESESMPNGLAVATIEDVTDRRRIEAMRTDFVANISHELKTPVGAIAVLADALDGETDPGVVARVAARLGAEAHRAVAAIDDLLELSRIESGPRDQELVDLSDVVQVAVGRGRVADDGKGVTVSALESASGIVIHADRRQLESAIGNLVENAVKYSENGGAVQVRTRVDGRWIEVMVADQGLGIPAPDLDRIFERFYRVDRARSRGTGGTGLGLSIVRHVASNHGGEVLVSSTEGEGSTFVLRLPASLRVRAGDRNVGPTSGQRNDSPPIEGASS